MNLTQALLKICEIEMKVDLDLGEFGAFKPVRAWPFWPLTSPTDELETPCFFHTFRLASKVNRMNAFRELNYAIGIQLLISPSQVDTEMRSYQAVAVHEALMNYFDANMTLDDGSALIQNLRTENGPTLTPMEWPPGGIPYVGLDYVMDLVLHDQPTVGP